MCPLNILYIYFLINFISQSITREPFLKTIPTKIYHWMSSRFCTCNWLTASTIGPLSFPIPWSNISVDVKRKLGIKKPKSGPYNHRIFTKSLSYFKTEMKDYKTCDVLIILFLEGSSSTDTMISLQLI